MLDRIPIKNDQEFLVGKVLAYNSISKMWSLDHYTKCSFRCAYCIFDSQGNSLSTVNPDNFIEILKKDFETAACSKYFTPGTTRIVMSCLTDPYTEIESRLGLTRKAIEFFMNAGQPFSIITRGTIIEKDIDLLLSHGEKCDVSFSLPIADEKYLDKYEPHLPPLKDRIRAIFETHKAGIKTTVRICPWIPGITDVELILSLLPDDVEVLVSPLYLSEIFNPLIESDIHQNINREGLLINKYVSFVSDGAGLTAANIFKKITQNDINNAFIKESTRIGWRKGVMWFCPYESYPDMIENFYRCIKLNFR